MAMLSATSRTNPLPEPQASTVRVLCLGNDLLADDGFGPAIARQLSQLFPGLDVVTTSESGLYLLDHIQNTKRLIIIDVIVSGRSPTGTIYRLEEDDLQTTPGGSPHYVGLLDTIAIGRKADVQMPDTLVVLAVEAADLTTVGGPMSPGVRNSLSKVVDLVRQMLPPH
jgi:hydrogenase maturation protease